ncbi:lysylphosphatidylglycerol synthase domain-containing protein [Flaviaesturariibacter aridisoli]|uniref:lysylphosphatidylglycerol synthase domain-containing protein n=1 Tax=Flaviaesturariibacter aridisoli TaxID=2545761 RepID=UPI001405425A|nr:lysylphosphatidylglycerol synthase domain-containing protein [Flaviaesturariibacter aridisoli]
MLFAWLSWSIWRALHQQQHLAASWEALKTGFGAGYLLLLLLLMFCNWGLEAIKWRILVAPVQRISFVQSFKAVLSGVSFSISTPNRIGEYLGRMLYLPEGRRLKIIALTLVGSLAQLLVTLWAGCFAFFALRDRLIDGGLLHPLAYQFGVFGLLFICSILTLFYFNVGGLEKWLESALRKASWLPLVTALQEFGMQRLGLLLLLSVIRYAVFVIQYLLAFRLFSVTVSLLPAVGVMSLVFLALAVIPSVVLLEVGIRGEVSLKLIGLFSANSLGILLTSVTIWLINLVIPALAGSILILGIKLFKQRYEET